MQVGSPHALLIQLCYAFGAGIGLVTLARRLNVPVIVALLFGGIALGPAGLGFIQPGALGNTLKPLVGLAVGVVLFEGGLTLDLRGFAGVSGVIRRLLSVGVLVTWLGTAVAIWAVFGHDPRFSLLAASLVIVTGPTVIVPLLRRIKVEPRLHTILHWEGVMIDAIGVFIAILCFEWLAAGEGARALLGLGLRVVAGLAVGVGGGWLIDVLLRRRIVPDNLVNAFALGMAVFIFGLTETVIPEAGLLSVTMAGLFVGWRHPVALRRIQEFKAEITDLLIGTLFVLLAARLDLGRFVDFGWRGALLLAVLMLVVRPLNVLASSVGSPLTWRERLFLSWVAPRGIVAASMASLFALELAQRGAGYDAAFLETFVYSVIAATVVLQGLSAGAVAGWLGVRRPDPEGWLIVGANRFARAVACFLQEQGGREVTVVDNNPRLVGAARGDGLAALQADALDPTLVESRECFRRVGHVLALTDNAELNELVCQRWRESVPRHHLHRWSPAKTAERGASGMALWERLPRPALLSEELRRGEASLDILTGAGQALAAEEIALLHASRGRIAFQPDATGGDPAAQRLVLRRLGSALVRGLAHGDVVDVAARTFEEVQERLAHAVAALEPVIQVNSLRADIAERERAMPTFLGHGVAVPHAFVRGLNRRLVLLGRLREGLLVPDQDCPVTLVFLIVSPSGDPEGHLATLADVAQVCSQADNRSRLLAAADHEAVLALVRAVLR